MTVEYKGSREDAIKNCCYGIAHPEAFIQALEALGLIKFQEEKYLVIDIVEPSKVIIKRNGVIIYEDK